MSIECVARSMKHTFVCDQRVVTDGVGVECEGTTTWGNQHPCSSRRPAISSALSCVDHLRYPVSLSIYISPDGLRVARNESRNLSRAGPPLRPDLETSFTSYIGHYTTKLTMSDPDTAVLDLLVSTLKPFVRLVWISRGCSPRSPSPAAITTTYLLLLYTL